MVALALSFSVIGGAKAECGGTRLRCCGGGRFPAFLPKEVHEIKDPFARTLAQRIQRLPVQTGFSESCIMSSCVKPVRQNETNPVVLLHCFDSSCLEWRSTYPLLEEAGLDVWAVDVLGWGFSDLEIRPPCNVAAKRHHLYQLWKSHIRKPMILVGPSLGGAAAIDFAVNYPDAVSFLKSIPLRLYANVLTFGNIPFTTRLDWTNVKQRALVIWAECDNIVSNKFAMRLYSELPNSVMRQIPDCGHLPHVEKPNAVAQLIADFARSDSC
ncbi:alpha/beta-Hydrolases superfamily protein [Actinidia rufa]|uniref:Alpha/beta-Hydrolases superfamily protein n=1 Tax=Actinidia rufa TaxID=165716 RepID=A0A7J0H813_9ERIC|nr:alpha/beta-Hydrolases superfamily protein [Actinidia rufa]